MKSFPFPFAAIVGMELPKRSLLYHAVDPRIGGTVLLGHRGCAKSTLVRGFGEILSAVNGDGPDAKAPFVEVPLGVTEDRLVGSVDAAALVESKRWEARSGLLEQADGGVLYIDEVNLLQDHLSDLILDSAASGRHTLERDGLSKTVRSRYILVGTMNPEEGELRPQLLDRFAHGVPVTDPFTVEERMEIVKRRLRYDDDPERFLADYAPETEALKKRIAEARARLAGVAVSDGHRREIAEKAHALGLEGMRPELAVLRTARCAAAWAGRAAVAAEDLAEAWQLCLGHRSVHAPQPPLPPATTPPTPPENGTRPPQRGASSPAPVGVRAQPPADTASKQTAAAPEALTQWLREATPPAKPGLPTPESPAASPIAWLPSLLASAKHGWLAGEGPFLPHRPVPSRRNHLWLFLDASRSSGMSGFLARIRSLLEKIEPRNALLHVLLLKGGETRWIVRNGNAAALAGTRPHLATASGGSHLAASLLKLNRALLRKGRDSSHRILVLSDGLNSRIAGETARQSLLRLRNVLRRLTGNASSAAWAHPPAAPGLSRWLREITAGLPIRTVELG